MPATPILPRFPLSILRRPLRQQQWEKEIRGHCNIGLTAADALPPPRAASIAHTSSRRGPILRVCSTKQRVDSSIQPATVSSRPCIPLQTQWRSSKSCYSTIAHVSSVPAPSFSVNAPSHRLSPYLAENERWLQVMQKTKRQRVAIEPMALPRLSLPGSLFI